MKFVTGSLVCHPPRDRNRSSPSWPRKRWTFLWEPEAKKLRLRGGGPSFVQRLVNPVFTVADAQIEAPIEYYRIHRIEGDGRCLFRALAQGISRHKNVYLSHAEEEESADQLRMAVHNALCLSKELKHEFRDVIQTLESPLPKYCKQLKSPTFWGGEPELLVLSQLIKAPIHVYKKETEFGSQGTGMIKIVEYARDPKKIRYPPIRVLYSGSNHYDLLQE